MLKQLYYVSAVGITDGFEAKTVDPTIPYSVWAD